MPSPTAASSSRWAVWLATGLGAGYLPKMPGTYGSVEGVIVFLALETGTRSLGLGRIWLAWALVLAVVVLTLLSVWITARALPHFSSNDPQVIVIDEIAGQSVTLLALAFWPPAAAWNWTHLVAGFILFRIFDISKPLFIRSLDKLPGAWGVVADDIGAGVVGGLLLWSWGYFG
ncbi:MAG: phosphatidylglycerophosphatase A [Acidobacteria bacterium]|nr:phosphatidylglycerophosphatase A [Acidobacteriota bacterium]